VKPWFLERDEFAVTRLAPAHSYVCYDSKSHSAFVASSRRTRRNHGRTVGSSGGNYHQSNLTRHATPHAFPQAPECFVVKSVSSPEALPASVPPQVHESVISSHHQQKNLLGPGGDIERIRYAPLDRFPHAHVDPLGPLFSVCEREHVHEPAGR